jgi:XapX domain-containing protein
MKIYLFSLGAGVLVGVIYHLIGVRSPAPPLIALVGLLGILAGEQLVPLSEQYLIGAIRSTVTLASDGATTASGSLQHGISRVTAARKTARNEEARS